MKKPLLWTLFFKKKSFILLPLLSLLAISNASCSPTPDSLLPYVVTLSTVEESRTYCTGVKVGRHAVMTAKHCLSDNPTGYEYKIERINGIQCDKDFVFADDGTDNVLIWTCQEFEEWADISKVAPKIADRVYQWGHVLGRPLMYREGYLSQITQMGIDSEFYPGSTVYVWDIQDAGGDSGSAVFNSEGEVVCITSHGVRDPWTWPHFAMMACFPPKFTAKQLSYL